MAKTHLGIAPEEQGIDAEDEKPILRRFWTSDTTREAVAVILEE